MGIGSRPSVDGQLEIPVSTVERCNMIRVSTRLAAVMSSSLVLTAFAFEPSLAQAPAEGEAGRFTMTPVAGGALRLDTRTGRISHCKNDAGGWTCTSVADERAAYEEEIARLQARLAKVEAELAARSAFTPPSDADLDRAVGFMEKFFRRFMAMIENLKREYGPNRS